MLLGQPDGFEVGKTSNACTKGLWLWNRPLKGQTTDGREAQVLVIDTEGIDSTETGFNNDVKLLFAAISMSSSFVYNTMSLIEESQLVTLGAVSQLIESSRLSSSDCHDSAYVDPMDYSKFFPPFLWVVRDADELETVNKE